MSEDNCSAMRRMTSTTLCDRCEEYDEKGEDYWRIVYYYYFITIILL